MNGNVPAAQLVTIDEHGTRLRDWCAAVWQRMVVDAAKDGVTLKPSYTPPPAPAGLAGYRSYSMQLWLYRHPLGPVPIAMPGHSSHGLGNRLDVGSGVAWCAAHMTRYGLYREFADEPWHFGFRNSLAGLGLTPITNPKETPMATNFVDTSTYKNGVVQKGTRCMTIWEGGPILEYERTLIKGELATTLYELYGTHKPVPHDQFEAIRAAFTRTPSPAGLPDEALRLRLELEGTATPV